MSVIGLGIILGPYRAFSDGDRDNKEVGECIIFSGGRDGEDK